jgi:hypothetical protein
MLEREIPREEIEVILRCKLLKELQSAHNNEVFCVEEESFQSNLRKLGLTA